MAKAQAVIVVDNLVKDFKGFVAVAGVSFEVMAGEIFGFLGPNGAGKTTTVKMLCTLLHPTAGTAKVAGYDILRQPSQVRKSIGIIFQDPSLDDRLTAKENLRFHGIIYKVPNQELPQRITKALEWMELSERANDLVRNFSGGMKRRLEIARGLLHSPQVLFLDEPTLGLDPQTRYQIWQYLIELRHEKNITLFMTTHYMDEAEYCDRIAIIDYGKIIALDTPHRLKARMQDDIVNIKTEDDLLTEKELWSKYKIKAKCDSEGLHFAVPNGAEFVPKMMRELNARVKAVTIRRPTLDDVFLKLTGREIREDSAGNREKLKSTMRRMGRAWR